MRRLNLGEGRYLTSEEAASVGGWGKGRVDYVTPERRRDGRGYTASHTGDLITKGSLAEAGFYFAMPGPRQLLLKQTKRRGSRHCRRRGGPEKHSRER